MGVSKGRESILCCLPGKNMDICILRTDVRTDKAILELTNQHIVCLHEEVDNRK